MARITVHPDALRLVAQQLDEIRHEAGDFIHTCLADAGNAEVAAAYAAVAAETAATWARECTRLEQQAASLRRRADLLEAAQNNVCATARAARLSG